MRTHGWWGSCGATRVCVPGRWIVTGCPDLGQTLTPPTAPEERDQEDRAQRNEKPSQWALLGTVVTKAKGWDKGEGKPQGLREHHPGMQSVT